MKQWYELQASANKLNLKIYGDIGGYGVNAVEVMNAIESFGGDEINVDIHSRGGSAFDGVAIYNALLEHPATVNTNIKGIAASSASVIYMAGDNRSAPSNTYLMIHNPWLRVEGDYATLDKYAQELKQFRDTYAQIYVDRTGIDLDEVNSLMLEETWIDGKDAVAQGFSTELTQAIEIKALSESDRAGFNRLPEALSGNALDLSAVTDIKSFEKILRDVGASRSKAKQLASHAKSIFQRDVEKEEHDKMNAQLEQLLETIKSVGI